MPRLRAITMDDLPLYEALMCDPVAMAELGGPRPREGLPAKLGSIVESVNKGESWYFVVEPDDEPGRGVGTVCLWRHDEDGELINEAGWMVLPSFQGQGLATGAVKAMLERARDERRWDVVHAFPGVTNAASNAICRKAGFVHLGEKEIDYDGLSLRCNHWAVDVRVGAAGIEPATSRV